MRWGNCDGCVAGGLRVCAVHPCAAGAPVTCIVYSAGTLAADSLTTHAASRVGGVRKITRGPSGAMAGAAGDTALCHDFLSQVEAGTLKDFDIDGREDGFNGLLVTPDGMLHRVGPRGTVWPIDAACAAIGSGMDIALGALHMGATAQQAVEAAIAIDTGCGGPVQVERLSATSRPTTGFAKLWDVT